MAETPNPGPPSNDPGQPGVTPPVTGSDNGQGGAPPTNASQGAPGDVQVPEGFELIKTEDKNALISKRDQNFDRAAGKEEDVSELRGELAVIQRDRYIESYLKDNKDKFPDVSATDLEYAASPDDIEAIAKRVQGKADKIREKAREELTTVGPPTITREQRAERLAEAEKNHDLEGFIDMSLPQGA